MNVIYGAVLRGASGNGLAAPLGVERRTPEPNVDPGGTTPPVGGDMKAAFVPRWRTLSGFAVETGSHDGIGIESLAPVQRTWLERPSASRAIRMGDA